MMHSIFGTKHLIIVAICIALIVVLFLLSKKVSFATACKIMLYVGIVSEVVKIFSYIIMNEDTHGGILPKTDLPFHLCSIQILFVAVLNFSKNEKLKRFLIAFMFPSCLIGGAAAILIATNSSLNAWVITFQYFLYHVAIIVLALKIVTSKELKLNVGDYFNALKFVGLLMFFAIYINSVLYDGVSNINFMYVASPPQSGLPFLTEKYGWFVYIVHYACLILFAISACYAKPIYTAIKGKISKNTPTVSAMNENTAKEDNAIGAEDEAAVSE